MKVAVVSEDFRTLRGQAGKARRFLLFKAKSGRRPELEAYYELPEGCPTYHELHEDDQTAHPIDGMVLIANEAGEGFRERLAGRRTKVHITSERDPHTAVALLLEGKLPEKAPNAGHECHCGQT
jgi:predicted Fe-Mo cluster-binding NifX family protein